MTHRYKYGEGDRALFAIHAVRYLATRKKDRSSDEMLNWFKLATEKEKLLPDIPDYAIDMHTARGQKLGRTVKDFYSAGAKVSPELEKRVTTYRERVLRLLEKD
jgi:hypothetical protein